MKSRKQQPLHSIVLSKLFMSTKRKRSLTPETTRIRSFWSDADSEETETSDVRERHTLLVRPLNLVPSPYPKVHGTENNTEFDP